jgi:hypothetical protein
MRSYAIAKDYPGLNIILEAMEWFCHTRIGYEDFPNRIGKLDCNWLCITETTGIIIELRETVNVLCDPFDSCFTVLNIDT